MRDDKLWNWIFALFLISIPVAFLGNFLIMGLIYLLMAVLDLIAGYNRNGRRDLRGYISLILTFLYGVLFLIIGIADMSLK